MIEDKDTLRLILVNSEIARENLEAVISECLQPFGSKKYLLEKLENIERCVRSSIGFVEDGK